jgi:hypothetical protein
MALLGHCMQEIPMLKLRSIGIGIVFLAACAAGVNAAAQQTKPATPATKPAPQKPAKVVLPAAVDAAFKKAYPTAAIKNVIHETEDGQEQYEIESIDHGMKLDVNYKPNATVIVIEQEVAAADVPAAVMAAITARYPKATLTLRERATENKTTYYEIGLKGAPVASVQLTPEGKWISPKPGK